MRYGIDEDMVEKVPLRIYNLRLFTILNYAYLIHGMGKFEFSTPEEKLEETISLIDRVKKEGYAL